MVQCSLTYLWIYMMKKHIGSNFSFLGLLLSVNCLDLLLTMYGGDFRKFVTFSFSGFPLSFSLAYFV